MSNEEVVTSLRAKFSSLKLTAVINSISNTYIKPSL